MASVFKYDYTAATKGAIQKLWYWYVVDPVLEDTMKQRAVNVEDNSVFTSSNRVSDAVPWLCLCLFFCFVNFLFRLQANRAAIRIAKRRKIRSADQKKFAECVYYVGYYVAVSILGLVVLALDGWSPFPASNFWNGWPMQPFSRTFRTYYMWELAFYMTAVLFTLCFDGKRSDRTELVTHHFVTIALIASSFWMYFFRVGLMILIIHNVGDIFLYATKAVYYWNHRQGLLKDIMFGCFAASFFVTRLVFFPLHVLPSCWFDVLEFVPGIHVMMNERLFINVCLWLLQSLHVFWFAMIARMVYRLAVKGEVEKDIRSDDEEDAVPDHDNSSDHSSNGSGTEREVSCFARGSSSTLHKRLQTHSTFKKTRKQN
eukprot:ANDGO_05665.mRNA.1 Ceramide synthase hyl-1